MDEWIKYEILEKPSDHKQRTEITALILHGNKIWMIFSFSNIWWNLRSVVYAISYVTVLVCYCQFCCLLFEGYRVSLFTSVSVWIYPWLSAILPPSQLHKCPEFKINWNDGRTCLLCCQDLHRAPTYSRYQTVATHWPAAWMRGNR